MAERQAIELMLEIPEKSFCSFPHSAVFNFGGGDQIRNDLITARIHFCFQKELNTNTVRFQFYRSQSLCGCNKKAHDFSRAFALPCTMQDYNVVEITRCELIIFL